MKYPKYILLSMLALSLFPGVTTAYMNGIQFKDKGDLRLIDVADRAGFEVVRRGLHWSPSEKIKGKYDFAHFDEVVDEAKANGQTVLATLFGTNELYEDFGHRAIITDEGRAGFAAFAAAAAEHYEDEPVLFEIWNEPNLRSFWRAHPANPNKSNLDAMADEYVALVRVTAPAIKRANPDAYVSVGSISAIWSKSINWFDRALEQGLLNSDVDAVTVHPYGFLWPELSIRGYETIREMITAQGHADVTLANSEVGYSNPWIARRGVANADVHNMQAAKLVRQHLVDEMMNLDFSVWYQFRNGNSANARLKQWGVLERNGNPKSAYLAAVVKAEQLDGYEYVRRLLTDDPKDYVLEYRKGDDVVLVAWTIALSSRQPARDKVFPATLRTTNGDTVTISPEQVVSMLGATANMRNQAITISEFPVYISLRPAEPVVVDDPGVVVDDPGVVVDDPGGLQPTVIDRPDDRDPVVDDSGRVNVALGKSVSVSSGNRRASRLIDGNVRSNNSRWFSSHDVPQEIVIDLGSDHVISGTKLMQSVPRAKNITIDAYQAGEWVTVINAESVSGNDVLTEFSPVTASKLRYTINDFRYLLRVFELEVYGNPR